jgi:kynurenine formamidase
MSVITRRSLLATGAALSASAALFSVIPAALAQSLRIGRIVDLSHTINDALPQAAPVQGANPGRGTPPFVMEPTRTYDKDKMNINRWILIEHNGTHIDAPLHFSRDGMSLEMIPLSDLVVPLVLIDISRRAEVDPETAVMVDDIKAWEKTNGPLPQGCCVAMNSGWGKKYNTPAYNGRGADGKSHVPGFHIDTAKFLLTERNVKGIGVDTASLDQGSKAGEYPVHNLWLPAGHWGLEGLNNLDQVPAKGATIVVGALKVKGATGGPARIMALI